MAGGDGARPSVCLYDDPDCASAHPTGTLRDEIMRIRSPKDFWAGLIFIAIGGGFVLLAQQYRLGAIPRLGPALFPTLVGALLALSLAITPARVILCWAEPRPHSYTRPVR